MADNVAITAGSGTSIATDDAGAGGHVQRVKLSYSADGSATPVQADADGILINLGANNDVTVAGDTAHDATDSGNPVKIGGKAETTVRAAVQDGDRVDAWFDQYGRLVVVYKDSSGTEVTVGTAGTPSTSVNSVQGIAAMYPLAVRYGAGVLNLANAHGNEGSWDPDYVTERLGEVIKYGPTTIRDRRDRRFTAKIEQVLNRETVFHDEPPGKSVKASLEISIIRQVT